ncbi:YhcB family protein [Ursidibacter sp. B-7004-1]
MEQWSNEIWLAIVAAFIVGAIIGYVVLKATNANAQKQQKLENELKVATAKLDAQKEQLEQHFQQSANLLATLAEDYKKLYTHLAKGSQNLLPDEATQKIEFFKQSQLAEKSTNDDEQPKDYSEGSSGILKAKVD